MNKSNINSNWEIRWKRDQQPLAGGPFVHLKKIIWIYRYYVIVESIHIFKIMNEGI
jgi:hypothetical protein